jgi:hypothetical protein
MGNLNLRKVRRDSSVAAQEDIKPSPPIVTLSDLSDAADDDDEDDDDEYPTPKYSSGGVVEPPPPAVCEEICLSWKAPKRYKKMVDGYRIEMWDLPTRAWVEVTSSSSCCRIEDEYEGCCSCVLSNILSGLLYQFRIVALLSDGRESDPSDPSDAFIVDIPDVNIAPYFVGAALASSVTVQRGQDLVLRADALGTPKPSIHWYKDGEEVFITGADGGITIIERNFGTELKVDNVGFDDCGIFSVSAINTVGKCNANIYVTVTARPEFLIAADTSTPPPPGAEEAGAEGCTQVKFREGEMVRVKLPLIGVPPPLLSVVKVEGGKGDSLAYDDVDAAAIWLKYTDGWAIFQINCALPRHSGGWLILARNECGQAEAVLQLLLEDLPERPGTPIIDERSCESADCESSISLSWKPIGSESDAIYHVEYYRDQWELWLKGKTCKQPSCTLTDLVPGSYYKFRVRTHTSGGGLSAPSTQTESIFIGQPQEDEIFGLPGENYSKLPSQPAAALTVQPMVPRSKRRLHSSLLHLQLEGAGGNGNIGGHRRRTRASQRQASLDREVYYAKGNERKEVVTYSKLGSVVFNKYRMSKAEEVTYTESLHDLCSLLRVASSTRISRQVVNVNTIEKENYIFKNTSKTRETIPAAHLSAFVAAVSASSLYSDLDLD